MNRRNVLKLLACSPLAALAGCRTDAAEIPQPKTAPAQPWYRETRRRRGSLYVMLGAPKIGKTSLAGYLKSVVDTRLTVVDTPFTLPDVTALSMLHDGYNILLVQNEVRSAVCMDHKLIGVIADHSICGLADWVFRVVSSGQGQWHCETILDHNQVYNEKFVWDLADAHATTRHVRPLNLSQVACT